MPTPAVPVITAPGASTTHAGAVTYTWLIPEGAAPVVALVAPGAGATVTAGVPLTLAVTATDATSVTVSVNGGAALSATYNAGTSRWERSYTPASDGAYTWTATATGPGGATTTAARAFTAEAGAPANVAPVVAMVLPASGASVTAGDALTLAATALDSDGSVSGVTFSVNGGGALAATYNAGTSRWERSYTPASAGAYSVTATATDNGGATTTSAARAFTVTAAPTGSTYVDDFSGHAVGAGMPAGWEAMFNYSAAVSSIAVIADGTALQGKLMRVVLKSGAGGRAGLALTAAGTFMDGEILIRSRTIDAAITGPANGAFLRGAGTTISTQAGYHGYAMGYSSSRVARILPYVAGAAVSELASVAYLWATATWYYTRLRVQGSVLKLKVWAHGESEPAAWTLGNDGLLTDTQLTGAGKAGLIIHSSTDEHDFDYIAVAVGTGTAPMPGA